MWKKFDRFFVFGFFAVVSFLLILIWFRQGLIYGGGDVGLQTYNPSRILENARYVWWEAAGPGAPLPQGLSAIPFQFFLFLLQAVGFSPIFLQATLFLILLSLMGYGMYLFLRLHLEEENKLYPIIGALFYMLNPYMMIQVWHRFIHTTIFLAASLPFLALFWSSWIKKGSFKSFLLFLLTNVLSVYLFGTFAFIITVWIFLTLITVSELIPRQGRRKLIVVASRFLYGFIIWLLINCWWLIPVFKISPVVLSEQHKTEESLVTLINISAQAALPYTLQLTNPFYLFSQADFGSIYKNPVFQLIPWFFVSLVFLGLIFSLKQKKYAPFGIFFIVSIFLAKGASPPFGHLYISGFINFFPLGVLRNPFEKTGLILAFFATVLFVMGFKTLVQKFENKTRWLDTKVLFSLVLFFILIYSWPMWTGHVLGGLERNAFVDVPVSYKLADQWLIEQKLNGIKDGKLLHLPLTTGESIKYKWKYGYNGLEPSDTFFTAFPSISRGFNVKRIDDALTSLSSIFDKRYFDKELALKYLQDFNVRFIVLHKDIDWLGMDLYDPLETEKLLDGLEFMQRKREFGDLILYQLNDKYYQAKVSLSSNFDLIYPGEDILKQPYFLNKGLMITPFGKIDEVLVQKSRQILIFPKIAFKYGLSSTSAQLSESLLINQLENYQVSLEKMGFYLSEKLTEKVIKSSNQLKDLENNLDEYQKIIKQIFHERIDVSKFAIAGEESALSTLFRFQMSTLKQLESTPLRNKIIETEQILTEGLISNNLLPKNPPEDSLKRQFFSFEIPARGKYTLQETTFLDVRPDQDKLNTTELTVNGNKALFEGGWLNLDKGDLEISYPINLSDNLAPDLNQLKIQEAGGGVRYIEVPITASRGGGSYQINIGAKSDLTGNLRLLLFENNQEGGTIDFSSKPILERSLAVNPGDFQQFAFSLELRPSTKKAVLIIQLPQDNSSSAPPAVLIKELKVQKIMDDWIILTNPSREDTLAEDGIVTGFVEDSPVHYHGSIKIDRPTFLFFKETFHPGWKLSLSKEGQTNTPREHHLANLYGNAWYIEKEGEYDFKLEFEPQKYVNIGILLTILGGILIPAGISTLR